MAGLKVCASGAGDDAGELDAAGAAEGAADSDCGRSQPESAAQVRAASSNGYRMGKPPQGSEREPHCRQVFPMRDAQRSTGSGLATLASGSTVRVTSRLNTSRPSSVAPA